MRAKVKEGEALDGGEIIYLWIATKARDVDLTGNSNPTGTFMNNYATVYDKEYRKDTWYPTTYLPRDEDQTHT